MMKMFMPQKSRNDSHSVVVCPPTPDAEQRRPAGNDVREERVERLAADPRLDAEPAARDERAHQRRQVRADRAVGRAREDGERDAVLRARMRVQQDRDQDDGVAEHDGERAPATSSCPTRSVPTPACRSGCSAPSRSTAPRSCRSSSCAARSAPARGRRCRAGLASIRARSVSSTRPSLRSTCNVIQCLFAGAPESHEIS